MDVSSVSAPSVTIPSRSGAGTQGAVPSISSVSAQAPTKASGKTDTPTLPASNTGTSTRDAPSSDSLAQAVKQVNDSFTQNGQNLYAAFEKDKATGIDVVKIVDKKTHETIRQLPLKEMVALAQFLQNPQGLRGKLIHTTA